MYPIAYEADYERNPNRVTTFFRYIVAIPWLIVAYVYLIAAFFSHIAAWFAVLFTGRYPEGLYNFNSGILRYVTRVNSWFSLQTDKWPPFGIGPDPTYPVRLQVSPRAEKQSRLKALVRIILIIPALIMVYIVSIIHTGAAMVAWLTIVFRGYQPAGIHNALMFTNGYNARVYGYFALLTDTYPPVGAEQVQVGDVRPSAPAAPLPEGQAAPTPPSVPQPPEAPTS
jgi:hypothetical protein